MFSVICVICIDVKDENAIALVQSQRGQVKTVDFITCVLRTSSSRYRRVEDDKTGSSGNSSLATKYRQCQSQSNMRLN